MEPPDGPGREPDRVGTGSLPDDVVRELELLLAKEQADQRLPSLIVGLVRDGTLLWCGARGATGSPGGRPPTSDTQYRIGSISKTFTAVLVMRLRDEGAVDLADGIGEHLPEVAALPVTVGQLLSHTSGLQAEPAGGWWERTPGMSFPDLVASSVRPADLLCRPGRRFHYSNVGFAVLGELAARKRSRPYGELVRQELLQPLGMDRTSPRPEAPCAGGLAVHPHADVVLAEPEHDAVAMAPAGQLWSTVDDLVRWSTVLAGKRPDILNAATVDEMAEPIALADLPGQPWTAAYGLGLQVSNRAGQRAFGHLGAMPGHWAVLLLDQATEDGVVAFANSTYQGMRPAFVEDLFGVLARRYPRPVEAFHPTVVPSPRLQELLGAWYWGPVEYRMVIDRAGELVLRGSGPGLDCRFRSGPDETFTGRDGYFAGERLHVHRQVDGSVSHLEVATFVLTRAPYEANAVIPGGVDPAGWRV